MSSMRDAVADKLAHINQRHESLKRHRFGFLVRPTVLILGWVVVIVGIITIPFPGPGWLTVFVGIGILSLELHWASGLLAWGVRLYDRFFSWYHVQPKRTRYSLIAGTLVAAWVAGIAIVLLLWKLGFVPFLDPIVRMLIG